jgi:hypothetical protein
VPLDDAPGRERAQQLACSPRWQSHLHAPLDSYRRESRRERTGWCMDGLTARGESPSMAFSVATSARSSVSSERSACCR